MTDKIIIPPSKVGRGQIITDVNGRKIMTGKVARLNDIDLKAAGLENVGNKDIIVVQPKTDIIAGLPPEQQPTQAETSLQTSLPPGVRELPTEQAVNVLKSNFQKAQQSNAMAVEFSESGKRVPIPEQVLIPPTQPPEATLSEGFKQLSPQEILAGTTINRPGRMEGFSETELRALKDIREGRVIGQSIIGLPLTQRDLASAETLLSSQSPAFIGAKLTGKPTDEIIAKRLSQDIIAVENKETPIDSAYRIATTVLDSPVGTIGSLIVSGGAISAGAKVLGAVGGKTIPFVGGATIGERVAATSLGRAGYKAAEVFARPSLQKGIQTVVVGSVGGMGAIEAGSALARGKPEEALGRLVILPGEIGAALWAPKDIEKNIKNELRNVTPKPPPGSPPPPPRKTSAFFEENFHKEPIITEEKIKNVFSPNSEDLDFIFAKERGIIELEKIQEKEPKFLNIESGFKRNEEIFREEIRQAAKERGEKNFLRQLGTNKQGEFSEEFLEKRIAEKERKEAERLIYKYEREKGIGFSRIGDESPGRQFAKTENRERKTLSEIFREDKIKRDKELRVEERRKDYAAKLRENNEFVFIAPEGAALDKAIERLERKKGIALRPHTKELQQLRIENQADIFPMKSEFSRDKFPFPVEKAKEGEINIADFSSELRGRGFKRKGGSVIKDIKQAREELREILKGGIVEGRKGERIAREIIYPIGEPVYGIDIRRQRIQRTQKLSPTTATKENIEEGQEIKNKNGSLLVRQEQKQLMEPLKLKQKQLMEPLKLKQKQLMEPLLPPRQKTDIMLRGQIKQASMSSLENPLSTNRFSSLGQSQGMRSQIHPSDQALLRKMRGDQKQDLRISTRQDTRLKIDQRIDQRIRQDTISLLEKQVIDQKIKIPVPQILEPVFKFPKFKTAKPPRMPPLGGFLDAGGANRVGRRREIGGKRRFKYAPSLAGVTSGRTQKRPASSLTVLTGFEIRPVVK